MARSFEALAKQNGEIRIYLETDDRIDGEAVKSRLEYSYGMERPHRISDDPWDYCFADPRPISSEADFFKERDRVVEIFATVLTTHWEAEISYHPPRSGAPTFHWSSTEGVLHPSRVVNPGE